MALKAGDKIPTDVSFLTLVDDAPTPLGFDDIFANKKVAFFAVPGAFTPGCSKTHCPSFVLGAARLKQKGIDAVYCTAVNGISLFPTFPLRYALVSSQCFVRWRSHRVSWDLAHMSDAFVLDAWAESQGAKGKITFLADGNGDFARKIGLTKETGAFGGTRSARYALIATNGVVDYIAVDEQGVDKTTADSLLANL
ncbi:peroxiredoxin, putative [Acanthamoeba castellanii str. Neff]|uniref:Peroxiredoxin, putative n=1 Tax=Acanthamoeba castellanii (strain ATCC 30010 / Neff) TaxID=1257118 RepID=L8HLS8_ACACF|nr:peroxiredoxin, putative [Acanthamoeba castellanii str. Neff]ELR25598.1 peroxiredoxin, putative [Acanthamoeba castellanii str. Neff]